jgi:F0F1-type ATP synthase membrane subunit a
MILSGDIMLLMNIIPALIIFLLTFLEFGVALVQTYIFVVLTSMYLKDIDSDH